MRADVPGMAPEDLEVALENGQLRIQGHRDTKVGSERSGWHRVERISGRPHRRVALPDTANVNAIAAECRNGLLEIAIPRQAKRLRRRIRVNAS